MRKDGVMGIFIGVGVAALIVLVFIFGPRVEHDNALRRFADQLYNYPPPSKTQIVSRDSQVGLLSANGNHCDYRVVQIISSELSVIDLNAYYQPLRFAAALPPESKSETKDIPLQIEVLEPQGDRTQVRLTLSDFGYPPGLDFRCM